MKDKMKNIMDKEGRLQRQDSQCICKEY